MDKSSVPILYPQKTPENLTFLHYFHNASKMSGLKSVLFSTVFVPVLSVRISDLEVFEKWPKF